MRSVLVAAAALAVSCASAADALCDKTAMAAREIMKARQNGVPVDVMMGAADRQQGDFAALSKELVLYAYEKDRRFSPDAREREIAEFGNQAYLICAKTQ